MDFSSTLEGLENKEDHEKDWVRKWIETRFKTLAEFAPEIHGEVLSELRNYFKNNYKGSLSLTDDVPLPDEDRGHEKDFWFVNNYWPQFRNVSTPILDLISENDLIVPLATNSGALAKLAPDAKITMIKMSHGFHCSVSGEYWPKPTSALMQKFLLAHSPHFKLDKGSVLLPKIGEGRSLRFDIEIFPATDPQHIMVRLLSAEDHERVVDFPLSFDQIGWAASDVSESRFILQRWAAQNFTIERIGQDLKVRWSF